MAAGTLKAKDVSAGQVHSCAVTTKGKVLCWGHNGQGQLGDNSTTDSNRPVAVYGLTKGVKSVSAGSYHTCALTTKGKVLCWGYNGYGQLGNNTTTQSNKPVAVQGLGKVKSVSAGADHTCAVTTKSKAVCWGYNGQGQLGDNSTTNSLVPVGVYGMGSGVKLIAAGFYHSCAVTTKGKAKCWGYNGQGALGDGTTVQSNKPVAVQGLGKASRISAGYLSTCAVTTKGAATCWGYNGDGQLGDNSTIDSLLPKGVYQFSSKGKSVQTEIAHSCGLTTAGTVKCWGSNTYGQLGNDTTTGSPKPVKVVGLGKATDVTLGYIHTCAINAKQAVLCWGYNGNGQLGDGTNTSADKPVKVFGF
jgi:alpha-tubulin suppressor-like RCC1 family protein